MRFGHSSRFPAQANCLSCQKGKQARTKFPTQRQNRSKHPFDLVVSDIAGPFQVRSRSGNRYALTFIDDATRHTTVFFLEHRSDAFTAFQSYKTAIESRTGRKIKTLGTDNGGEYTALEFDEFLRKNGIHHQTPVAYTPQQNGIGEQYNKTLLEMGRTKLIHSGLAMIYWQDALSAAAQRINRLPTKALPNHISPHEALTGKAPRTDHLVA